MFFVTKAYHERIVADYIHDLDESEQDADHYRNLWIEADRKVKVLEKEKENMEFKHREKERVSIGLVNSANKNLAEMIQMKRENHALRQILTDITGKTPEELIAAHERAIRLLEYGIPMEEIKSEE